jgi:medium-chain acyl-[acyl-carrier-protein] hydrolase
VDTTANAWIRRLTPADPVMVRLYCFPFAGGSASVYHPWSERPPPGMELAAIELPGRHERLNEPRFTDMRQLVPFIAQAVAQDTAAPRYVFFGHSMGAVLAFETIRELRRSGAALPEILAVSGRSAPHLPSEAPRLHLLPDDEFISKVTEIGGIHPELIAHQEFMKFILPMLRDDFAMAETYEYTPGPQLNCPVIGFSGADDPLATLPGICAWNELTTGGMTVREYPGRHFFAWQHCASIIGAIADRLHTERYSKPASPIFHPG